MRHNTALTNIRQNKLMTLNEIKQWYHTPTTEIPKTLKVESGYYTDVRKSIQTYIRYLETHSGNSAYLPYFEHLKNIYLALK